MAEPQLSMRPLPAIPPASEGARLERAPAPARVWVPRSQILRPDEYLGIVAAGRRGG
jgi:hypothetical protein